jgi:predicted MFS family arabinose efflux permease
VVESKVAAPLLPLRVVANRNRGGVYLSLGLAVIAMFGLFLFLTYYLQVIKGYSPVVTGLAFLPMVAGMITGSTQIGARLMTRVAPRKLMGPGFLVGAVGMLILTRITVTSSYPEIVLPGLILLGLGLGTAFMPAMSLATYRVEPRDAGVASAMINTSQQVGGSIGTALLNTIAASTTAAFLRTHTAPAAGQRLLQAQAAVHGYAIAIWWGLGILLLASALAFVLINTGHQGGTPAASGGGAAEDEVRDVSVPVIAH